MRNRHTRLMIAALAVNLICGCATTRSGARFSEADPRISEVAIALECREGYLMDTVEYLNDEFAERTGSTNYVVVSALTQQQEAESPPITLSMTAPLSEILPQLAAQALVRLETRSDHVALLPDITARDAYTRKHADLWAETGGILNSTLEALQNASSVTLWSPENREMSAPVTDQKHIAAVVNWITSQPLAYDEFDSKARAEGTVCGCLPWVIEFGDPKQTIAIHGHNLIVNSKTSFRPARGLDLDDFRSHLQRDGVIQQSQERIEPSTPRYGVPPPVSAVVGTRDDWEK